MERRVRELIDLPMPPRCDVWICSCSGMVTDCSNRVIIGSRNIERVSPEFVEANEGVRNFVCEA